MGKTQWKTLNLLVIIVYTCLKIDELKQIYVYNYVFHIQSKTFSSV